MGIKFKCGDENNSVRMCGHTYQGGRIYDNDTCRLPLKVIEPWIIGEKPLGLLKKEEPQPIQPILEVKKTKKVKGKGI